MNKPSYIINKKGDKMSKYIISSPITTETAEKMAEEILECQKRMWKKNKNAPAKKEIIDTILQCNQRIGSPALYGEVENLHWFAGWTSREYGDTFSILCRENGEMYLGTRQRVGHKS